MELCKWTVDLSVLPSFQEDANTPQANGFYTGTFGDNARHAAADLTTQIEFELGLELDSAEVRGILIHAGQDWGHVVFDFRS